MSCLHIAAAHVYETNGRARETVDKRKQYGAEKIRCACRVIIFIINAFFPMKLLG
jgi:hypothetical protein